MTKQSITEINHFVPNDDKLKTLGTYYVFSIS